VDGHPAAPASTAAQSPEVHGRQVHGPVAVKRLGMRTAQQHAILAAEPFEAERGEVAMGTEASCGMGRAEASPQF